MALSDEVRFRQRTRSALLRDPRRPGRRARTPNTGHRPRRSPPAGPPTTRHQLLGRAGGGGGTSARAAGAGDLLPAAAAPHRWIGPVRRRCCRAARLQVGAVRVQTRSARPVTRQQRSAVSSGRHSSGACTPAAGSPAPAQYPGLSEAAEPRGTMSYKVTALVAFKTTKRHLTANLTSHYCDNISDKITEQIWETSPKLVRSNVTRAVVFLSKHLTSL